MHSLMSRSRDVGKRGLHAVGLARRCPLCGTYIRRYQPFGEVPRPNEQCPACGGLARHRLIWAWFQGRDELRTPPPKRLLHVAPEPPIERRLRAAANIEYLSGDLTDPRAMVKLNVTDIRFPDATFDLIYCSHVLEHVPDDRKAMREFLRVLKPGSLAVILVPITADVTVEDPSITDPAERLRLFGQDDHVRRYGPDFEQRLVEAGFDVQRLAAVDILGPRGLKQWCVPASESPVYVCRRPA